MGFQFGQFKSIYTSTCSRFHMGKPLYRRGDLKFVGIVMLLNRPTVGDTLIHCDKVYRIVSTNENSPSFLSEDSFILVKELVQE